MAKWHHNTLYIILPHHRHILGDRDIVPATRPHLRPACVLKSSAWTPRPRLLQVFSSVVKLSLRIEVIFFISRCSSKFYYDFSRCKLEREEAARRGLNRRSRQIHHNSASTGQEASLVLLTLATLWTQKCLWWLFFGWGRVGWVWRKKIWRGCKSTRIARNRKITTIPTFWCKPVILSLRLLIVLLYTSISNRRSQRRILTTWNNKLSIVKKHLKWKHDKITIKQTKPS